MKRLLYLCIALIAVSCSNPKNSPEFVEKATGRYLFNADEIIEIYFKEQELFAKWRGNDAIEPVKVNDSTFYIKEMNEKLVFYSQPNIHIKLAHKREHKKKKYVFTKLGKGEKTPREYLNNGQFDLALKGYQAIKQKDSLNPTINQWNLNRLGYQYLRNNEHDKAIQVFQINIALYPKSSNTYDSLGDAYLKAKDTTKAKESYKKALVINPENRSSKKALRKLNKK